MKQLALGTTERTVVIKAKEEIAEVVSHLNQPDKK